MESTICLYPCKGTTVRGVQLLSCYQGDTNKAGRRHGHGTYHYPNGFFKYSGQFLEGKKHGLGKLWMQDGTTYEGYFENDEIQGQGCRHFANGNVYTGAFCLGEMHGFGVLQLANGDKYEGMFADNKLSGQGTYTHSNGDIYTGEFAQHKPHGHGSMEFHNGDRYEGNWSMGRRCGHGLSRYHSQDEYEGDWEDDEWQGQGTWRIWRYDIQYRGQFTRGRPEVMASKLNVFWFGDEAPKKAKDDKKSKDSSTSPILEIEAGQRYPRPLTLAAQGTRPLAPEEVAAATAAGGTPATGPPLLYAEQPPEGCAWTTASMEYGRKVLMTLHASSPQPLAEDKAFGLHLCTVEEQGEDEEGGVRVRVKLLLLQVQASPCLPMFIGDDEPITGVLTELQAGQHVLDPFILGDMGADGTMGIPEGSYTVMFSSYGIEPGLLQVRVSNKWLKTAGPRKDKGLGSPPDKPKPLQS